MKKALFKSLIADFFLYPVFSQDPFDRKQREQTEYPKEGLTLPPVSTCVYSETETGGGTPIGSTTYCGCRAIR